MPQAREIFRDTYDGGDRWGSVMAALFDIAAALHPWDRVPSEWEYRPGAMGPDDTQYADCDPSELEELGETLWRWRGRLEAAGLSY